MSVLIACLLLLAFCVFVSGCVYWIWKYSTTPAPLNMPTMPAPRSVGGVLLRLVRETVLFESLFKASKWTWVFGWLFHASLLFVLLCHLRFFVDPVWWWVSLIAPYSKYGGMILFGSLVGLLVRRIMVARVRYISTPSDYLMLIMLLCLAGSGLLMRYKYYIDLYTLREFALGITSLTFNQLPPSSTLLVHLLLVALLLLIFPFSKLVHAIGLYFSPSRNQRDNTREKRFVNRWDQ